jgi:hypothetical protein
MICRKVVCETITIKKNIVRKVSLEDYVRKIGKTWHICKMSVSKKLRQFTFTVKLSEMWLGTWVIFSLTWRGKIVWSQTRLTQLNEEDGVEVRSLPVKEPIDDSGMATLWKRWLIKWNTHWRVFDHRISLPRAGEQLTQQPSRCCNDKQGLPDGK